MTTNDAPSLPARGRSGSRAGFFGSQLLSGDVSYSSDELAKARREAQDKLRDLQVDLKESEIKIEKAQNALDKGVVTAGMDGIIKTAGDPKAPPTDGSAFITVSGTEGLYVKSGIKESKLGTIKEGDIVMVTSWQTGGQYPAEIKSISPYPDSTGMFDGSGTETYYPFTAVVNDKSAQMMNGEWVEVSDETADLLIRGLEYSIHSDGDFDITVGGVTKLWDFHAAEGEAKLPDEEALAEAVKHVGFSNLEIKGNKVRLKDPETEVDLGGIAKGYIGDMMTDLLEEKGVVSATINLGGNVICIGSKTDEDDFVIGVEAPFSDRTEIVGKIGARDMTLVTSGVYERKIEVDGKLYHHILSTKTGYSADTDLDAVTLTAGKGHSMDADALSTICLIKGYEEASKLIEQTDGVEAVFVLHDGTIQQTSGAKFEKE